MAKSLGTSRHEALEAARLTQAHLAAKLAEYQSFVARLESGQRRVDVVEFLELAEVLGFDASDAIDAIAARGRRGPVR